MELTVTQHAMWHFAEWQRCQSWQDKVAWQGLAGIISHEEAVAVAISEGGKKGGKMGPKHVGNHLSPEAIERIRQSKLGKPRPQSVKDAVREAWKTRVVSEESKRKMSEAQKARWAKLKGAG